METKALVVINRFGLEKGGIQDAEEKMKHPTGLQAEDKD